MCGHLALGLQAKESDTIHHVLFGHCTAQMSNWISLSRALASVSRNCCAIARTTVKRPRRVTVHGVTATTHFTALTCAFTAVLAPAEAVTAMFAILIAGPELRMQIKLLAN